LTANPTSPNSRRTDAPDEARESSIADVMVPAPEGNSVLLANPADGSSITTRKAWPLRWVVFRTTAAAARGDGGRSIAARSHFGVYTTTTKLPKSGVYDVAFLLDSPRITHCFNAEAKPNPEVRHEKKVALRLEFLNKDKQLRVGEDFKLRFKLVETATSKAKSDLNDVRVLTMLSSATWQKRDFARSVGDGVYELDIKVPETGVYLVFVESKSQGVAFRQLPYLTLQTAAEATNNSGKEGTK
jgi:hypothetical protein